MKARKIDPAVLGVLSRSATNGAALVLPGQLDRDLYVRTNKVLEALGGKWNRKAKAHLFPSDAEELVDAVVLSGEVALPEDFGYFPTPPAVVAKLMERANVQAGMYALEPSAGTGAIVGALLAAGAVVDAVELLPKNAQAIRVMRGPVRVFEQDFLALPVVNRYDRVVMNPPFAKRADIRHVMHAVKFLKAGGRLVSVMSAGVAFREDRLASEFRAYVENVGSIEPLPEGSFEASGTSVNTVLVEVSV